MNLKKMLTVVSITGVAVAANGQSVAEIDQAFYYEKYQTAQKLAKQALQADAGNTELLYWHTRSGLAAKDTAAVQQAFQAFPASDAPYYLLSKGIVELTAGNTAGSEATFRAAIDRTKGKNADVLGAIGAAQTEAKNGNPVFAHEVLAQAQKRAKKNATLWLLDGNAYRDEHNGNAAYSAYREAIDKDAKLAAAHFQMGRIFLTQKNAPVYLQHFNDAVAADPNYTPAIYALYTHYRNVDPTKSMDLFKQYAALAEPSPAHEYAYTDLLYLNKKYDSAIVKGNTLIQSYGEKVEPRIYKLLAYSHQELKDSATAIPLMYAYFDKEIDSNYVMKDFENMGLLLASRPDKKDSAIVWLERALPYVTDSTELYNFYSKMAGLAKTTGNQPAQAKWLGKYYVGNPKATNVHLFNWGIAAYRAGDYQLADTAFGIYTEKYPEQGFGFYWRARTNAAIDTAMTEGLAIAHYQHLIEVVRGDSTVAEAKPLTDSDKQWMVEAYSYLAAYETNTEKDYPEAIQYFTRLLEVDPENATARKYIEILEKQVTPAAN